MSPSNPTISNMNPDISVMVNPIRKVELRRGAVTTPNARFTMISATRAGSATSSRFEYPRAPQPHRPQQVLVDDGAPDGQALEAVRQRADQHQVAVDGEIGERAENHEQCRARAYRRRAGGRSRLRTRVPSTSRWLTGEGERLERELHDHPDGDADQDLLHGRKRPAPEKIDRRRAPVRAAPG